MIKVTASHHTTLRWILKSLTTDIYFFFISFKCTMQVFWNSFVIDFAEINDKKNYCFLINYSMTCISCKWRCTFIQNYCENPQFDKYSQCGVVTFLQHHTSVVCFCKKVTTPHWNLYLPCLYITVIKLLFNIIIKITDQSNLKQESPNI